MILFIGVTTISEDIRCSKIKNSRVFTGIAYAVVIYFLSWILYAFAFNKTLPTVVGWAASYLIWSFDKWCVNLLISILVAYFLWHFKMWGGGDAKLFICYSALIPMGQYSKVYFNYYFPSFLLLLAIFIPSGVYIFLKSAFFLMKNFSFIGYRAKILKFIKDIKDKFCQSDKKEIIKVFMGILVFFLFFRILRAELGNLTDKNFPNHKFLPLVLLFGFRKIASFFKKNTKFILAAFIILLFYFIFRLVYSWQDAFLELGYMFSVSVSIMMLSPVIGKTVKFYSQNTAKKTMPFAHWMFLGALISFFWP